MYNTNPYDQSLATRLRDWFAQLIHNLTRSDEPNNQRKYSDSEYAQLTHSRRVIVEAYETERRRIERDLHDGTQQSLVAASLSIGEAIDVLQDYHNKIQAANHMHTAHEQAPMQSATRTTAQPHAQSSMQPVTQVSAQQPATQYTSSTSQPLAHNALARNMQDLVMLADLLTQAQQQIERSLHSLRQTVHEIHPQVLEDLGLITALKEAFRNYDPPIEMHCPLQLPNMPEGVLATAYFFTLEVVNNAKKYCHNAEICVLISMNEELTISVSDTGPGGAHIRHGGGLEGIRERLETIDGSLRISSPPGGPTIIACSIPLMIYRGEPSYAVHVSSNSNSQQP